MKHTTTWWANLRFRRHSFLGILPLRKRVNDGRGLHSPSATAISSSIAFSSKTMCGSSSKQAPHSSQICCAGELGNSSTETVTLQSGHLIFMACTHFSSFGDSLGSEETSFLLVMLISENRLVNQK
jgi:hypothetical protein